MRKYNLLDLRYDASFKALFEKDEDLLLDFINAIVEGRDIVSIEELNTNMKPVDNSRGIIFDILVKDSNGLKINIEMEKNSTVTMKKRTQFYWAKAFTRDLVKGDTFNKLTDTICINILGLNIFNEDKDYKRKFIVYDEKHKERLDSSLEIYFVELSKTRNLMITDKLSMWATLLNDSSNIEDIIGKDPMLDKAISKAEELNMDDELSSKVLEEQQREFEERSRFEEIKRLTLQEGLQQGLEQGLEKGLEQGLLRGKAESVTNLINSGFSEKDALKIIGLTTNQYNMYKN